MIRSLHWSHWIRKKEPMLYPLLHLAKKILMLEWIALLQWWKTRLRKLQPTGKGKEVISRPIKRKWMLKKYLILRKRVERKFLQSTKKMVKFRMSTPKKIRNQNIWLHRCWIRYRLKIWRKSCTLFRMK